MSPQSKSQKLRGVQGQVAKCYSTWGKSYFDEYYRSPSAYPPVHFKIVKQELKKHRVRDVLDAGCGPASMLRGLREWKARRFGFDLTLEMVEEARRVLARQGVPRDNIWQGSVLQPSSYRCLGEKKSVRFGSVICFGVLPHIPEGLEGRVFALLRKSLKPGGLALVEARNELFSLFTCNRYSYRFLADRLIGLKKNKGDANKAYKLHKLIRKLKNRFRMDLPPIRRGKSGEPGYDEVLSRLHNPLVAARQFAQAGFKNVETLFYHYHCLPPMFEDEAPIFFRKQSLRMENPRDWRGHFMASAFILKGIAA